jgi:hypothetical protein
MENSPIEKTLQALKAQVLNLLNDLMEIFPDENDILLTRLFFETQADPQIIMDGFIKWVYPWKKKILEKNEEFFDRAERIFGPIDPGKIKRFKIMWKNGELSDDEKVIVWKYFEVYIKLIDKYLKQR